MLERLASFTLSGKLPAFTVVFSSLLFSLVFPPSTVISCAALVLLTLQAGPRNSILIMLACVLGLALCSHLLVNNAATGALIATAQLLPSFILAITFFSTRSLSLSMQLAALLGALTFIIITANYPDNQQLWLSILTPGLTPLLQARDFTPVEITQLIAQTAKFMTATLIASVVLLHSGSLLFGYKLHSLANNNTRFDTDFRHIRLGKVLAIMALLAGIWAFLAHSAYAAQLCGILLILFSLPGMAVIHTTCGTMTKGKLWLIIAYLLVLLIPQMILIVILLGLFETFFKLRQRVR